MPSHCYDICNAVDECDNDINKILALMDTRNVCIKKEPNIKNFLPKGFSGKYVNIKGKCMICDFNYMNYDGLSCPCCGIRLRLSPYGKTKMKDISVEHEPVIIVRSHVGYTTGKGHSLT